LYAS
jgi:Predicted membrane protein